MRRWRARSAKLSRNADAQTRTSSGATAQRIEELAEVARIARQQSVLTVGKKRYMGIDVYWSRSAIRRRVERRRGLEL
jgi:hypothetical protein